MFCLDTDPLLVPGFFITGTDTEVGKTWITAALIKGCAQQGYQVIARKPIASGCIWQNDQLLSEDAQQLQQAIKMAGQTPPPLAHICPYLFEAAISPARAIAQSNDSRLQQLRLADLHQACLANHPREQRPQSNLLLVEGAGGFYSPIAPDGLNADLAQALGLPIVLVIANRLGCLNHALLTIEAIEQRQLKLHAVILNDMSLQADPHNFADLQQLCRYPVLHQRYQTQHSSLLI